MSRRPAAEGSAPDYQGAVAFALHQLHTRLPSHLVYHGVGHTETDVLPATQRLARLVNVAAKERMFLAVAAAFHDLGFIEVVDGHEAVSVAMARSALPAFGFGDADLDVLAGLILATKLPQSPTTLLEEIMSDADLDVLGRADFSHYSEALRQETANLGAHFSGAAWAYRQLKFMRGHRYFTAAARSLRAPRKAVNIAWLEDSCPDPSE